MKEARAERAEGELDLSLLTEVSSRLMSKRLRWAVQVLLVLASAGFLAWLLWRSRAEVAAYPWAFNYGGLASGFLLYTVALGLAILGWHLISRQVGNSLGLREDSVIFCLSNGARRLPGGVWGVLSRVYLYKQKGASVVQVSLAMLLEALVISLAGVSLCLAFALTVQRGAWPGFGWPLWLALTVLLVALVQPRLLRLLLRRGEARFGELLRGALALHNEHLLLWWALYLAIWLLGGGVLFYVVMALYPVGLSALPTVIAAWALAGTVSMLFYFMPTGLGVTEVTLALLLSTAMPSTAAVLAALVMRLFITASELFWAGVVWALWRRKIGPTY